MRHITVIPTSRFETSDSIIMLVGYPILAVWCTVYSFIQKLWWQSIRLHHASGHLLQRCIIPLSNTILLRCVGNRVLHLDTCIFTIINELKLDIFTTIIISEDLEFPSRQLLNQGLENIEVVKNFRIGFKKVNPTVPRKFIYEGKDIIVLTHGHMREGNKNQTMD